MTGYLLLTNGDASFARSGPLAMTRAVIKPTELASVSLSLASTEGWIGLTYKLAVLWKTRGSGCGRHARAAAE